MVNAAVTNGTIKQAANVLGGSQYTTGEDSVGVAGAHIDGSGNCDDFENT